MFRLPLKQPLAGTSESSASSPSTLQPVVTEQRWKLHKNRARKVTRHRKFKLSLGFGQKYLYERIWRPDKPRHLDWAKHASLYGETKKKTKELNLWSQSSGHSINFLMTICSNTWHWSNMYISKIKFKENLTLCVLKLP